MTNKATNYGTYRRVSDYTIGSFLFDLFMIFMTGGLWLLWVFVREMRR